MSLPFQFDAARAYSSALRAEGAPPATTATLLQNSPKGTAFVAEVADVAGLASPKYEVCTKCVVNVAGGNRPTQSDETGATLAILDVDEAEREAIAIELGGVPAVYASAFARLQAQPPAEVPRDRWHQFINDAGLLLDYWGKQAEALGLRSEELFGLDPDAPMARYDRMGLIWMLHGETVVEITATEARLSGGLTFYRKG